MKKRLKILEWIHATLIFALFIPFTYALFSLTAPEGTALLYLKCLLVAAPVIVTGIAAERVRTLGAYILICVALLAVLYEMVVGVPLLMGQRNFADMSVVCYRVVLLGETVLIAALRLLDRVNRRRYEKRREMDPFALRTESFLNRPSPGNAYFILMYIAGILLDAKLLCDTALFSAFVYLFLALAYTFFETTEHYLVLNKRTKGIPRKRLYLVSGGMLCLYGALLLAASLPSFLLINARRYTDLREWFKDVPLGRVDSGNSFAFQPQGPYMGGLEQLPLESVEEAPAPSVFWEALFWGLGIVCALVFVWGIIAAIKQLFRDFCGELDENGDKIENLEENTGNGRHGMTARERDGETLRIRRLYKRTIRKHRKERPAIYETPIEIEEKAGLAEDAAMQALHTDYERARYGR